MDMENCIFCKIAKHELDSKILYENGDLICFKDIHPAAPVHILIVPKVHYKNILELGEDKSKREYLMSKIIDAISLLAKKEGISESGFRVINNCGYDGGQTVDHLHFHLLGGVKLKENLD